MLQIVLILIVATLALTLVFLSSKLNKERVQKAGLQAKLSALEGQLKHDEEHQQWLAEQFKSLSNEALAENSKKFFETAEREFKNTTEQVKTLVSHSQEKLKTMVDASKENLNEKFQNFDRKVVGLRETTSKLEGSLEEANKHHLNLEGKIEWFGNILSNKQARGTWGERAVKAILDRIGLRETIDYEYNKTQDDTTRPDFIFKLPRDSRLVMDVKFPIDNYRAYTSAPENEKESKQKQFLNDFKKRIKEVVKYVSPKENKVDFALMYVPSESIYRFVNEADTHIIEESFEKKIILCSPTLLYAILCLVWQSIQSFKVEQHAVEVQQHVQNIQREWVKFTDQMGKVGKSFQTVHNQYSELEGARRNQLEKPMNKIIKLDLGKHSALKAPAPNELTFDESKL